MTLKNGAFGGLLSLALALVSYSAVACTCSAMNVDEARKQSDAVFSGRVVSITYVDSEKEWEPRIVVEFAVDRVWKGDVGKTFFMHTNFESSSCVGFFREILAVDKNLVVYANGVPGRGWKLNGLAGAPNAGSFTVRGRAVAPVRADLLESVADEQTIYTTSICTRTTPLESAEKDVRSLGKPSAKYD